MNLEKMKIVKVNDGDEISEKFSYEWDIVDYCNKYNGKIVIAFVGFVLHKRSLLFSFPKHYNITDDSKNLMILNMKKILKILALTKVTKGSFDRGEKNEFPMNSYLDIASYYKRYGLYTTDERYFDKGYSGNINWKKTIKESNKIISKKGIIFDKFILNKKRDVDVFISECMDYALNDAAQNYKDLISLIIPYKSKFNHRIFSNLDCIHKRLVRIRNEYFKDIEKRLINSLIVYFQWKSKTNSNVCMMTTKFENYWENMIEIYLNHNFGGYHDNNIIWEKDCNKKVFYKPSYEYIERENILKENRSHYKIQYDHFSDLDENNYVYVFDSKYFNKEVRGLNYKQMVYHYILKNKYPNATIINGLIIPTEREYYTNIHIDRTGLDDVKIIEHYVNFQEVLNFVIENKDEYRLKIMRS